MDKFRTIGEETDWAYGEHFGWPWPTCEVCGAQFMCGFSRYRYKGLGADGVGELDVIGVRCADCHLPVQDSQEPQ